MKLSLKISLITIVFIYSTYIFLPKQRVYFYMKQNFLENNISIIEKNTQDNYTNFTIENAKLFYENINSADIKKIKFSSLLFTSKLNIINIKLNKDLQFFPNLYISKIILSQNIFSFNKIKIKINIANSFINGNINLNKKVITLNSKQIPKTLKPFFKKINKGYKYEYRF